MNLGTNIRKYRTEKHLTQEKFAYELGISAQAVSRWENGITYPDISMLPVIADYFEISIDELMCRYKECSLKERETFFKESRDRCDKGDFDGVISMHREMLAKYPNDVYIQFSLSNLLYIKYKDNYECEEEIYWLCNKIEQSRKADMVCGARRLRVLMHMKNKEFEEAKRLINELPSYMCGREIMMEKLMEEMESLNNNS